MNTPINVDELRKKSLFVATPMYGGQCFGSYQKSVLDLSRVCSQHGINVQFSFLFNESLITRARNYMADEFLRTEHTHMLFIDSDIDFNPMDVLRLLSLDKPIIGGPYPKKTIAWENIYDAVHLGIVKRENAGALADFAGDFVFNPVPGKAQFPVFEPTEVLEIGTGFMLIERSVFTKFAETYPQYYYTPDHNRSAAFDGTRKIYQFFQAEIESKNNRYLSEDYWFCQKAREAGISVWLCPWMNLKHHGTYIYSGSIPAMVTVLNERAAKGLPAPSVARMDNLLLPVQKAAEFDPNKPLSVLQYNNLAKSRKKEENAKIAEKLSLPAAQVVDIIKAHISKWVTDIPGISIEEAVSDNK